nr:hypothetical protein GCM10020185_73240 [Pseudomonas brassicacearum subsp. brassicacearum]
MLYAFGELFDQFPGSAAQRYQHVNLLKERRAYLIEVQGNNDCPPMLPRKPGAQLAQWGSM